MADKLKMETKNLAEENYKKLIELFPNIVTETTDENGNMVRAIDADLLQQEINEKVVEGAQERYVFTWPDKRRFIALGNEATTNTLRLDKEKSVGRDGTAGSIDTGNIYIEGDNLEALKLLRETYLGKVKMIYIDPPYNTGNDFIYNDDFSMAREEYTNICGELDEDGNRLFCNTKSNGQYHTKWLNMIYLRLRVAKDLLTEDGTIFISIDDNEQANLRKICDEIFGESNFVGTLIHQRAKGGGQAKYIVKGHDYIHIYSKSINCVNLARRKVVEGKTVEINGELYIKNDDVIRKVFGKKDKSLGDRRCFYEEIEQYKGKDKKKEIDEKIKNGEMFLETNKDGFHVVCQYVKVDDATSKLYSIIKVLSEEGKRDLEDLNLVGFSYPKPTELIRQLVDAATSSKSREEELILDFFSGSATTAHAVMQLNAEDGGHRKFIMVQLPEECGEGTEAYKAGYKNICEIGEERIRRAGKKIKEESPLTTGDLDIGFRVYRVDDSNMKDVYYKPNEITQDMLESLAGNIKEGRTGEDLLIQIMLELGVDLSSKIEETEISGKKVFSVSDGYMMACFDNDVMDDVVTQIAKTEPYYAVFRDSGMASDSVMTNYEQIFKTYSSKTIVKVL